MGLGRIVYASSGAQYAEWKASLGMDPGPLAPLGITDVAPAIPTSGPVPPLAEEIRLLVEESVRADQRRSS